MIHVITMANRAIYEAQLREMHAQRKQFFVDQLQWKACEIRGGGEYDDMDDDRAVYLLSLDDAGHVQAGLRMRPTDDKSIILDTFPDTIEPMRNPGRSPHIWEGSRIYQIPSVRGEKGLRVRGELRIAAIEFGLTRGIYGFLGMCDVGFLPSLRNNGWRTTILGPPAAYDEGDAFSFIAEVSDEALNAVREHYNIHDSVLLELPGFTGVRLPAPHEFEALMSDASKLAPHQLHDVSEYIRAMLRMTVETPAQAAPSIPA